MRGRREILDLRSNYDVDACPFAAADTALYHTRYINMNWHRYARIHMMIEVPRIDVEVVTFYDKTFIWITSIQHTIVMLLH